MNISENEKLLRTYSTLHYGNINILDYEEGAKRVYLRFIANSTMFIAEKTIKGNQILIYSLDRSVNIND